MAQGPGKVTLSDVAPRVPSEVMITLWNNSSDIESCPGKVLRFRVPPPFHRIIANAVLAFPFSFHIHLRSYL